VRTFVYTFSVWYFRFLYHGETFSPVQLVGAIITVAALYIANFRKNYILSFPPNPTSHELKLGMLVLLDMERSFSDM
jgi:drug/metabolite transporter (DMT)-like permease